MRCGDSPTGVVTVGLVTIPGTVGFSLAENKKCHE